MLRALSKRLQNIIYVGWLDANDLRRLLKESSVGLAPFPKGALNSLPNKPFEYMAASLPIITSLEGELRRMIEENDIGKFYPPGDAVALVDAILYFRKYPETLSSMGKRGRKLYEYSYRSDLIYPKFADHIKSIGVTQNMK